ncbi:hypothetical protein DBV15_06037 [Temnothorax longispinosus]|uniref:Uncharacterized protein n=1 Tax=Temnothorax longispinosus TaxID=300112 RepID=A0A4S2L8T8_9HYME|nr:hypothetical protein DBV15_06037 [Temnothorax longispinosus]
MRRSVTVAIVDILSGSPDSLFLLKSMVTTEASAASSKTSSGNSKRFCPVKLNNFVFFITYYFNFIALQYITRTIPPAYKIDLVSLSQSQSRSALLHSVTGGPMRSGLHAFAEREESRRCVGARCRLSSCLPNSPLPIGGTEPRDTLSRSRDTGRGSRVREVSRYSTEQYRVQQLAGGDDVSPSICPSALGSC